MPLLRQFRLTQSLDDDDDDDNNDDDECAKLFLTGKTAQ
jgi:hypothetical protein